MSEELKRLQTFIPAETLKKVKIVAAEQGQKLSDAVTYLLNMGVDAYIDYKAKYGDE